tara:strand:+ start:7844 stop:8560 length:717 start_codon:yes stop_codon:yes gene_type:complete
MQQKKNIHSIILARGGSKGIKNKNLKLINGKPLLYWSINSSLKSKLIQNTWVSSDSNKILNFAEKYGAKIIKRPKNLSGDKNSSESGWLHALNEIEKEKKVKVDCIVGIQNTSPLRLKNDLDDALIKFFNYNYDSMFACTFKHDIFFSWILKNKKIKSNYKIFKRPLRQKMDNFILENGSFYIFKSKKFRKLQNRLFGKIGFFQQNVFSSFQIDDEEDFSLLKTLMESKLIKKKYNLN